MSEPKFHQTNTHSRGEDTRQRLIEAGIEIFSVYGYEAASTRLIAEKAAVNLAAIPYYFGSKEGLYRAVAEYVVSVANKPAQQLATQRVEAALNAAQLPREEILCLLHELLDAFVTTLIGSDLTNQMEAIHNQFIWRELTDPLSAFDILYQNIVQPTIRPLAALIGRLIDKPSNDSECIVRAFAIFGQILIFRTARSATLKGLGWEKFTEERIELIRTVIQQHATGSVKELSDVEHSAMFPSKKPNARNQTAAKDRKKPYRRNRNLPQPP